MKGRSAKKKRNEIFSRLAPPTLLLIPGFRWFRLGQRVTKGD